MVEVENSLVENSLAAVTASVRHEAAVHHEAAVRHEAAAAAQKLEVLVPGVLDAVASPY